MGLAGGRLADGFEGVDLSVPVFEGLFAEQELVGLRVAVHN